MGRISRYLTILVVLGLAIVGFWIYVKYVRDTGAEAVRVTVDAGTIEEIVHARGEVVPGSEYHLEFSNSGIIETIYVREGDNVIAGASLLSLDTEALRLEEVRLQAVVAGRTADRARLSSTGSPTDIATYEARVTRAKSALEEAEKSEALALRAVQGAMDDAVLRTADLLYENPRSERPRLLLYTFRSQLAGQLENERPRIGEILDAVSREVVSTSASLHARVETVQAYTQQVETFLDMNSEALNAAVAGTISATTLETWKTAVASARATLNTKASALAAAEEARARAAADLAVAQSELTGRQAPARAEDIAAADAALAEAKSQVQIVREKIRKSTLRAPVASRVVQVSYREGEAFRSGIPAITLHALKPKVESEISELDIVRIREKRGENVRISFDAVPDREFLGTVTSIAPQSIEKEDDTYYLVSFALSEQEALIRSGMSADIAVIVSRKENVPRIPAYAVIERDAATFVQREHDGVVSEVPILLGISDGEYREVISGLGVGDVVIVPTD